MQKTIALLVTIAIVLMIGIMAIPSEKEAAEVMKLAQPKRIHSVIQDIDNIQVRR